MKKTRSVTSPEFLLVVIMLVVLTLLVYGILFSPVQLVPGAMPASLLETGDNPASHEQVIIHNQQVLNYRQQVLDYKKNILMVIITAFGAWVGAGAAYYFGRENMKQASESLLAMREPTPKERLRKVTIRDISPKPLKWTLKDSDTMDTAFEILKSESYRWFVPVVKEDGSLDTVLHEEAFWRFSHNDFSEGEKKYEDTKGKKVSDLLEFVRSNVELVHMDKIHVTTNLDQSAGEVNEMMRAKEGFLAIITDESGKPTHYITTGDIRKVLMQME